VLQLCPVLSNDALAVLQLCAVLSDFALAVLQLCPAFRFRIITDNTARLNGNLHSTRNLCLIVLTALSVRNIYVLNAEGTPKFLELLTSNVVPFQTKF
jgi:hypothetical protein